MLYLKERQELCDVTQMIWDRWLTNAAGGNITVKVTDNHWIMTPTLCAQQKHNRLLPEDILVVDDTMTILEGNGKITRETNMHMGIYETDPRVKAVIHCHPKEIMPFAAMGIEMPLILENIKKLGSFPCLRFAPATTVELAEVVKEHVKGLVENGTSVPYGALLREHGIIVADTSLKKCYDIVERLESNAYTYIQSKVLELTGHKWATVDNHNYNTEE